MEKTMNKKASASKKQSASKKEGYTGNFAEEKDGMFMDLFIDELKDIYWAEKQLVKSLPKMQKAATSEKLKTAFADHLETTRGHVSRLEEAFEILGKKAQAKKCEAMAGLTKEAEEIIEDTEKGTITRDVALIMAAQKVEHYEIATYGSLAQLAKTIGNTEVADLMMETLSEEKEADELLTSIAENNVTAEATQE